jgi:hypothetical protein
MYVHAIPFHAGFLLIEDLGLLPSPTFGQPFVPDDELILTKKSAEGVMSGFAGMHGKYWESDRFKVTPLISVAPSPFATINSVITHATKRLPSTC